MEQLLIKKLEKFRDALLEDAKDAHEASPNLAVLLKKGESEIALQAINCEYAAKMITAFIDAIGEKNGRS